jgi:hypothetical protein
VGYASNGMLSKFPEPEGRVAEDLYSLEIERHRRRDEEDQGESNIDLDFS